MLRQYNKNIKVRIYIIGSETNTVIDKYSQKFQLEVIRRPPTKAAEKQGYFCLNRAYLAECKEDSVLYIDGDTFIFGDVESIFDKHKDFDFAGATDDWIVGTPDWNQQSLMDSYQKLGSPVVPVFNGGLTLWNHGNVVGWANNLERYCQMCYDLPISTWLSGDNRNYYHRETFSICFQVSNRHLSYNIMDRNDVINLFSKRDLVAWGKKGYVVYHCFTQNWLSFLKSMKKKRKVANYKLMT